jgi:predicted RNase H-like nuclease (RuvC/YqgF family)
MDWTQILVTVISTIGGAILGGGFMMWFTRREVKEGKGIENMQKVVESMQKSLDAKDRIIEEHEVRRAELKADIDKKDGKIEMLLKEKSAIRDENDDLKTNLAVANMLKCKTLKCIDRDPPFGSIIGLTTIKDTDLVKLAAES